MRRLLICTLCICGCSEAPPPTAPPVKQLTEADVKRIAAATIKAELRAAKEQAIKAAAQDAAREREIEVAVSVAKQTAALDAQREDAADLQRAFAFLTDTEQQAVAVIRQHLRKHGLSKIQPRNSIDPEPWPGYLEGFNTKWAWHGVGRPFLQDDFLAAAKISTANLPTNCVELLGLDQLGTVEFSILYATEFLRAQQVIASAKKLRNGEAIADRDLIEMRSNLFLDPLVREYILKKRMAARGK